MLFRSATGKFPGGFFKREAKPSDYEVLISRLIDRALRLEVLVLNCCFTLIIFIFRFLLFKLWLLFFEL